MVVARHEIGLVSVSQAVQSSGRGKRNDCMMKFLNTLLFSGLAVASTQPNILFILTDDQDKHMGSPDYMPQLQKQIVQKGTTFPKHYCSTALCCPSRANIWTGRMPHNTNITDVNPPYGGYPRVVEAGWNDNYLPIWLQEAGYNTYYVGKLWNAHSTTNYNNPPAKGFNSSDFLLDPYTYRYYDAQMTRNNGKPVSYQGQYSTDVIADKARGFLDEAIENKDKPWFLTVAPTAPHSNGSYDPSRDTNWFGEPEFAPRHAGLFPDYQIPRDASFNKPIQGAVGWVKDLPELNETLIQYNDEFGRRRLRALQAVDEMIESLIEKLEKAGVLDNTYVVFSADNGYHIGQHRMNPGKNCGYETDINVPLAIRGPGIPENATLDVVSSHTDIAPTFLQIANAPSRPGLDGKALPFTQADTADAKTEHAAIEYWGLAIPEGIYGHYSNVPVQPDTQFQNNTYKALRLISDSYSVYYSVWCTNEQELFNMKSDPHQTVNLAANPAQHQNFKIANRPIGQIIPRLDALMMVLKSCDGDACRKPWQQLHPAGAVANLTQALDEKFDGFYARQPKVSFSSCANGYLISEEGPQEFNKYTGGKGKSGTRRNFLGI